MAAQLEAEPGLRVARQTGGLGELRVVVDGIDVVDTHRLWYPTPASVVERVQAYLQGMKPSS